MTLRTHLSGALLALGLLPFHILAEDAPREYVRAGADTLMRACTQDGHTLTLLARPGVEVARGERVPPALPVDAFMDGLSALVTAQAATLSQRDLLLPDSEGTRRLSDAVDAWIAAFNRDHGTRLAWAIGEFGVSDTPRAECTGASSVTH